MFTTSKACIFVKIKIIEFLSIVLVGGLILIVVFLQEFAEFLRQKPKSFFINVIT